MSNDAFRLIDGILTDNIIAVSVHRHLPQRLGLIDPESDGCNRRTKCGREAVDPRAGIVSTRRRFRTSPDDNAIAKDVSRCLQ